MNLNDCVFCNIANHTVSSTVVHEDDDVIIFKDILPQAPVHLQIIPKKHIPSVTDLTEDDAALIGKMVMAGKKVAEEQGVAETGYKLTFNVGKNGGQIIPHIHLHLMGGKQLSE